MSETLEELRARREALEAAAEKRKEESASARELADETRAVALLEALAKLEPEFGSVGTGLAVISTPEGSIVVKKPKAATYRKFVDEEKTSTEALGKLVKPCLAYPDVPEYQRLIEEFPAALTACADAVVRLAGHKKQEKS